MRYVLTRSLEGDGKMNAGDTLLATASQPCQLGCATTTNKLLPPAKDNGATGTLPRFGRRGTPLLAASGTQVRKDVFALVVSQGGSNISPSCFGSNPGFM